MRLRPLDGDGQEEHALLVNHSRADDHDDDGDADDADLPPGVVVMRRPYGRGCWATLTGACARRRTRGLLFAEGGGARGCRMGGGAVCWALAFNVAVVLCLAAASAAPWYVTYWRHVPPRDGATAPEVSIDRLLLWWWSGVYVHTTTTSTRASSSSMMMMTTTGTSYSSWSNSSHQSAFSIDGDGGADSLPSARVGLHSHAMITIKESIISAFEENKGESTAWERISWSNRSYGLSAAKSIYMASSSMVVAGFVLAVLLTVALLFGAAQCPTPKMMFFRRYRQFKSVIICLATLNVVFSVLSWGIFIYFPTALGNRCVPVFQCDMFFGSDSQLHSNPVESIEVTWSPFVGWGMALLSTPFTLIVLIIGCVIRRPRPPALSYRPINS